MNEQGIQSMLSSQVPTPMRVLLAEDDGEMRALMAQALRADGIEVVEAPDGHALRMHVSSLVVSRMMLQSGRAPVRSDRLFDVVVSDICMPGPSGLDVLEMLRDVDRDVPVLLMTGFGDEDVRDRVSALGAACFDKPFDLDELRMAVRLLAELGSLPGADGEITWRG
jgi:two-component system response regulator AtoC